MAGERKNTRHGVKQVTGIYSRQHLPLETLHKQNSTQQLIPIFPFFEHYIKIDTAQRTTVHGVYACGDNTTRMRTVANVVAMGTTAGMMVNKELLEGEF